MKPIQVVVNPQSVAHILIAIAVTLVVASTGSQLIVHGIGDGREYKIVRLFYLDAERNLPTAFSTLLLVLASLVTALVTFVKWKQRAPFVLHWGVLSCGFLAMAFDEAWSFHERLIAPMRHLLGNDDLGVLYFAWVVPRIALVLVLAVFFLRFLLHLPRKAGYAFLLSATLYLGGAIGVELVGGRFAELHGMRNLTYSILATVEEILEMSGLITFVWASLTYIAEHHPDLQISFAATHRESWATTLHDAEATKGWRARQDSNLRPQD